MAAKRSAESPAVADTRRGLLLISDLDGTLIDSEGKHPAAAGSVQRFNEFWRQRRELGDKFVLCTGNPRDTAVKLMKDFGLEFPDALVSDTGASFFGGDDLATPLEWMTVSKEEWDKSAVVDILKPLRASWELNPTMYPSGELDEAASPLKHSVMAESESASKTIVAAIASLPFQVKCNVHSLEWVSLWRGVEGTGHPYVDIMPPNVHKGSATNRLQELFPAELTVVAGDSGNDRTMFAVDSVKGVVVGSAFKELKDFVDSHPGCAARCYIAEKPCADGVIEGLQHFLGK